MRSALFLLGYLALGGFALDAREPAKSSKSAASGSASASHGHKSKSHSYSGSSSSRAASSSPPPLTVKAATTLNLFLGPGGENGVEWEASVSGVTGCTTTLALECTVGQACKHPISAVLTYGNDQYAINTVRKGSGAVETVHETCKLIGTTEAACVATINAVSGKSTYSTSSTKTFTGAAVAFQSVPVTAGASLLTSAASCASAGGSSSSASRTSGASGLPTSAVSSSGSVQTLSSTSSHSGAVPTSISQVYKILVVPGAAALLAGALV